MLDPLPGYDEWKTRGPEDDDPLAFLTEEEWNRRQPWLPPEDVETLRKVVGAIEALAVYDRGGPSPNWDAIDVTQDAVRAIIKKLTGGSPWNEAMDTTRTEGTNRPKATSKVQV